MQRIDVSKATDAELLDRFESGLDQRAMAELVRRHRAMVIATARRVLSCEQDIEDAFQATFFALAKSVASLRKKAAVAGWLHRVAHGCAVKIQAANRRRSKVMKDADALTTDLEASHATSDVDDPIEKAINVELKGILSEEMAKLPPKLHVAMVLCDVVGLSQRSAAEKLGVKPSTIHDRVTLARKTIRAGLAKRGVTLGGVGIGTLLAAKIEPTAIASAADIARQASLYAANGSTAGTGVPEHAAKIATDVVTAINRTRIATTSGFAAVVLTIVIGAPSFLQFARASIGLANPKGITYFDNFDDRRHDDGSPATWNTSPNQLGNIDASSGDLVVGPTEETNLDMGVAVGVNDYDMRDISARTQVRISDVGGLAFVSVRGQYGTIGGYWAGVGFAPELGGSVVIAGQMESNSPRMFVPLKPTDQLPRIRLNYDVRRVDTMLQIDAIGDTIEVWAWRAGTEMPSQPLYRTHDSTLPKGGCGVGVRYKLSKMDRGNSKAIFRFVHVDHVTIGDDTPTE